MFKKKPKRSYFNVKKEIEVRKESTITLKNKKNILIYSMERKSGATFFAFNLAKILSSDNDVTLIELSEKPSLFDNLFIEQREKNFSGINGKDTKKDSIKYDDISLLIQDTRNREKVAENKKISLINAGTINITDFGVLDNNNVAYMGEGDIIFLIIEGIPCELNRNIERVIELLEQEKDLVLVINKCTKNFPVNELKIMFKKNTNMIILPYVDYAEVQNFIFNSVKYEVKGLKKEIHKIFKRC